MTDPDPFDEIVRHLDLDIEFPETVEAPAPVTPTPPPALREPDDDQFYRRIERRAPVQHRPKVLLAWMGVIGGPVAIMITGILRLILPRPLLLCMALVFVASAIYLIAQLPERGPGEPNWPDDGAQL